MRFKFTNCSILALFMFCLFYGSNAHSQTKIDASPSASTLGTVNVGGLRDPDEKRYRNFFEGMEVFEKNHDLAPNASLRFKLYATAPDTSFDGLVLKIVGDKTNITIPVDSDHTFSLPKLPEAAAEDAYLTTNRKAKSFAWRVDIRSPGTPPNTRRLGDLRLECKIDLMTVKLTPDMVDPRTTHADPCECDLIHFGFIADKPVSKLSLVDSKGKRSFSFNGYATVSDEAMVRDRLYEIEPLQLVTVSHGFFSRFFSTGFSPDMLVLLE